MGYLIMNRKEREQAKVFELVKLETLSQAEASRRLGISDRWVRKKIKRYYQFGDYGLIHKLRGQASKKRWKPEYESLLIELLNGKWNSFGPTFATEKLKELYSINISKETVRTAMIRANIWKPKQKRIKHRMRRERKAMLGIMVQLDGSPHDWFEGRAGKCTLLVFIDDATSKILWLEFAPGESVIALMQATKNYIGKHGIPHSFYTDHGSVFHVNLNNYENDKKTQWERAVAQFGIKVNHAHSPQAKGRVERCNKTMQDRLIKEMRLAGISSIEAANQYLRISDFIEKHNQKYAVKALQVGDAHKTAELQNLEDVFCIQETRMLAHDFTITYKKQIFQLHSQQRTIIRPRNEIAIKTDLSGNFKLWIRKTELSFTEIKSRPKQSMSKAKIVGYKPHKPGMNSRRWVGGLLPFSHQESRVKSAVPAAEALWRK